MTIRLIRPRPLGILAGMLWVSLAGAQTPGGAADDAQSPGSQAPADKQSDTAQEPPRPFVPSETIHADSVVDFPVDI